MSFESIAEFYIRPISGVNLPGAGTAGARLGQLLKFKIVAILDPIVAGEVAPAVDADEEETSL
jgi:hypothetical protein